MYKFYNANARGRFTNDCVIRAISLAEDKTWNETYDELMSSVPDAIKDEAFMGRDVYLVCLNDFFIKSEYSDLGIEKVVLDNIYNLLQLYFNVDAAILVVNRESFNDVPIFHLIGNGFVSSPCGHSKWVYEAR